MVVDENKHKVVRMGAYSNYAKLLWSVRKKLHNLCKLHIRYNKHWYNRIKSTIPFQKVTVRDVHWGTPQAVGRAVGREFGIEARERGRVGVG
jgi:hypothetical protein